MLNAFYVWVFAVRSGNLLSFSLTLILSYRFSDVSFLISGFDLLFDLVDTVSCGPEESSGHAKFSTANRIRKRINLEDGQNAGRGRNVSREFSCRGSRGTREFPKFTQRRSFESAIQRSYQLFVCIDKFYGDSAH